MPQMIPSIRMGRRRSQVTADLGFLAELSGTWESFGFNLIGRPDKQGGSPVFLELNQTFETLSFTPISSTIPNRGFAVDDIELFGLTYLQKITDTVTGGALHIDVDLIDPSPYQPRTRFSGAASKCRRPQISSVSGSTPTLVLTRMALE